MPKKKPIKLKNLGVATTASVRAALGKGIPNMPGTLAGFIVTDETLATLGKTPAALAAEVAKGISVASGIKVKPGIIKVPGGGTLVGYLPPPILRR